MDTFACLSMPNRLTFYFILFFFSFEIVCKQTIFTVLIRYTIYEGAIQVFLEYSAGEKSVQRHRFVSENHIFYHIVKVKGQMEIKPTLHK